MEMIIVPRQARDKHRGNSSKKSDRFSLAGNVLSAETRDFFRPQRYSPGWQVYHWYLLRPILV
jgi:hypothetical protein